MLSHAHSCGYEELYGHKKCLKTTWNENIFNGHMESFLSKEKITKKDPFISTTEQLIAESLSPGTEFLASPHSENTNGYKGTYLTPSLWKGMRLQVSEGSILERSASGTSKDLASVPSNLAENAWIIALGRGSTSTDAIPPRRSTGCGTQHGQT